MLGLQPYAYDYDYPYVAGLTSLLCFAFCLVLMLMLMFTREPGFRSQITWNQGALINSQKIYINRLIAQNISFNNWKLTNKRLTNNFLSKFLTMNFSRTETFHTLSTLNTS